MHEGRLTPDELPEVAAAEVDGTAYRRWRMALPSDLPHGYHRLSMAVRGDAHARGSLQLIVAPARCHRPAPQSRLWGLTAQLYGVRSQRNWGMGDFTDLADLAERAAALGASAVGVNPLHALFPADANHISPYSPSSRLFLNVFYLDPEAVPDLAESSEARALLGDGGFRASWRMPAPPSWSTTRRCGVSSCACSSSCSRPSRSATLPPRPSARRRSALSARRWARRSSSMPCSMRCTSTRLATSGAWSWQEWPAPLRHPDSPEVAAFAREHRDRASTSSPICSGWPISNWRPSGARPRRRHAARPVQRHRRRRESGERHGLGQSRGHPERRQRRRAARLVQSARAELGLAPLSPGRPARGRVRAVRRDAAPQHAPCRRRAHRSRHGAAASVLDPGGRRAGRGRLCALPVRRPRAHHRARVGAPSLPGDRRGSRHGAARLPAGDAARRA